MQAIDKLNNWTNHHDPGYVVDAVRVLFALFLFYKGVVFMGEPALATEFLAPAGAFAVPMTVSHLVIVAHLCGGILLALGLLTRLVMCFFVPTLAFAVVVHSLQGEEPMILVQAAICLVLSIAFLVLGSGKGSVDKNLHMHA